MKYLTRSEYGSHFGFESDFQSGSVCGSRASFGTGSRVEASIRHILLIRHGETSATVNRKYEGRGNSPLSAAGHEQAQNLSRILAPVNINAVYSSPRRRCLQTAEAISEPHSLVVEVAPGLEEVDFGLWEGLTFTEIQQKYPDILAEWIDDPVHVRPPSGESLEEMASRVFQVFDKICSTQVRGWGGADWVKGGKHAEGAKGVASQGRISLSGREGFVGTVSRIEPETFEKELSFFRRECFIAIVTHGGPIRALLSRTDRGGLRGFWEYSVPPCAVYYISNVCR
jgi:broad specificity phosphatase PhoE